MPTLGDYKDPKKRAAANRALLRAVNGPKKRKPMTVKHWTSAIISPRQIKPIFKAGVVTIEGPSVKPIKKAIKSIMKPKRKPKDPLSAVKRKHPGPWKAMIYRNHWKWPMVVDANGSEIGTIGGFNGKCSLEAKIELARAIAKLGGGK